MVLTRNVDEGVSAGAKLRLRAAEDGKLTAQVDRIQTFVHFVFSTLGPSFPASLQSPEFNNCRDDRLQVEWNEGNFRHCSIEWTSA